MKQISNSVVVAIVLTIGMVWGAKIVSRTFLTARRSDDMIRVIGSARKEIHSDFIIWSGSVTEQAPTLANGYAGLKLKMGVVNGYLAGKGIPSADVATSAIGVETLYQQAKPVISGYVPPVDPNTIRLIVGYRLSQSVEIKSHKVDLVERISRQSTELVSNGVVLQSRPPTYIYTKMSALKVSMQAEASKDARNRAEQIAQNAGCHLGEVRFARMQVPSITPLYAASESDGGVDDTSALDKKITAIVVVGYGIR